MDSPRRSAAAVALLPDDAIVEILSRVPARSLCRFQCVSKAWRDLIADRLRCKKLPQTLEGFFYAYDGDDNKIQGCNSSDDGGGKGNGGGESSDRVTHGHFINTLGRSVPLASYSFLLEQPGIEAIGLMRSCNGLLLFGHRMAGDTYESLGYIVCNPATEQWVAVPSSGWEPLLPSDESEDYSETGYNCPPFTYLIFDPAVSSHFQLVQFWTYDDVFVEEVHTYSSETGVWSEGTSEWSSDGGFFSFYAESAFVHGMLHFSVTRFGGEGSKCRQEQIVAVDGEGKKCRIISMPEKSSDVVFVGQSQGQLHYMSQHRDNTRQMTELSIWALQDYGTEEWVLKHSASFLQLFGRTSCQVEHDYSVVAIHPDHNMIFFVQHWDLKLKSYDMDTKEVCTLRTLKVGCQNILPYVPYFTESSAFASKH
ncbi:F-box protein At5g07610-like [Panicum virgatum]|uniref:F-box domain-containing protein n=1 Tax=Panicum virgatum TaxID=38727 RepID=A0A8T0UIV8_PANVG|nr:F-box protein At5g07610-like [Panicum virgatum]KAG2622297.1 hypothetical protein PVAP13_3NG272725 [Panicum virgatum]